MSDEAAQSISHAEVERTLAGGFRLLRFSPKLEARFEEDTGKSRHRHLVWAMLVGLVLYNTSLGADRAMLPDVFFQAVLVKLGLVTPTVLVAAYALSRRPPVWLRETIVVITGIATAFAILFLIVRSHAMLAVHAHYSVILCVVFVNVILRARFWYACATSAVLLAAYALSIYQLHQFAAEAVASAIMLLMVTTIATLFANFSLEHAERGTYLMRLADQIRNGHLTLANQELSRISNLDATTGLTNRRGFDSQLAKLWEGARNAGQSVAALMLDVDHFKRFNDHYGHQAGDACLREVADAARAELRRDDELIARYGGEEFVILLPRAGLLEAQRVAERIRRAIAGRGVPHKAAPTGIVTASIGVAAMTVSGPPRELIEAADAALYAAKARGRNRVWPPDLSTPGAIAGVRQVPTDREVPHVA